MHAWGIGSPLAIDDAGGGSCYGGEAPVRAPPLLSLRAQRWIFELGTLVRTYVQNDTANGEGAHRANECASYQHRSGAADHVGHRPTSFVNS